MRRVLQQWRSSFGSLRWPPSLSRWGLAVDLFALLCCFGVMVHDMGLRRIFVFAICVCHKIGFSECVCA